MKTKEISENAGPQERKKGILRMFELLDRDGGKFFKAGALSLAALLQLIYYGVMLIWFPLTAVILVLTSLWLPMLMADVLLYPALDQHFNLTAVYEKLQRDQWGG